MEILKRVLKLSAIVAISPLLMIAMVFSVLSLPLVYLKTGEFEMVDLFGKTVDFLNL